MAREVNYTLQQNVSYSLPNAIASHHVDTGQRELTQSTVYDLNGYVAVDESVSNRTNQTTSYQSAHENEDSEHLQCQQNPSYTTSPHLISTNHDPDCRNNPSYNVVPDSVHLRNTPVEIIANETLDTYDETVAVQGSATNGAGDSDQDEEVYETVEDYLVQPPPPSYEYVISSQRSPIVTGSRPSPRLPPTHTGYPNTFHSSGHHTTSEQQLGNVPVTIVSTHKVRTGGEHYRLSVVLVILTIVLCQLHLLLCAIPAIVFSVKARKFKATGDYERAKRFDNYSFGFIIPGLVFIILTVILVALFPILGGLAFIIWLLICIC